MYTEIIELHQEIIDIDYISTMTVGLLSVVEDNDTDNDTIYKTSLHIIGMEGIVDRTKDVFDNILEAIQKALKWLKEKAISAYNKVVDFLKKMVDYIKGLIGKGETTSKKLEKLLGEYNG